MNQQSLIAISVVAILVVGGAAVALVINGNNNDDKAETITVTDGIGREVEVSSDVQRVACMGYGVLRYYSYAGDLSKLVAVEGMDQTAADGRPYSVANHDLFASLPANIGNNAGSMNKEALALANLDVLFISAGYDKAAADDLQTAIGAPVIRITTAENAPFDQTLYDSLTLIGKVVGTEDRAKEVIDYIKSIEEDFQNRTKNLTDDQKKTAYVCALAESGSHGVEYSTVDYTAFNALNIKNAYTEYLKKTGKTDNVNLIHDIGKENVTAMDAALDIECFILDDQGLEVVTQDYNKDPAFYENLSAFKNNKIGVQAAYNWYAENVELTLLNGYYIGKLVYPELFSDIDFDKLIKEITTKMLGKDLTSTVKNGHPQAYHSWNVIE